MTKTVKPKRKLKDIDFSGDGAHIALVSKEQGGPANNADYALVMKATKQFSDEFVQKAQRIKVEMDLPEFLSRFFYLMEDDAEELAKLMGWVDLDDIYEEDPTYELVNSDYIDMIAAKVESMDVMKSLYESTDYTEVLSKLDEDSYLALLKDQERIEKALKKSANQSTSGEQNGSTEVKSEVGADTEVKVVKASVKSGDFVSWGSSGGTAYGKISSVKKTGSIKINENVSVSAETDDPAVLITVYKKNSEGGWEPTDVKVAHKASTLTKVSALKKANLNKTKVDLEDKMTKKVESGTAEFEVEVVEKSALEAIEKAAKEEKEALEKALDAQKEELKKALEMVQKFEQEKKEALTKARFQQVKDAVKDEAKAEILFKAVNLLEDTAEFEAVVKSLKDMTDLAEKGEMFVEKGVSVEGEGTEVKKESAVAKILKSQTK